MDLRVRNPDKSTQKHRGTFGKMMEHVWTWTMSSCHPISIYHSYIIYIQSDVDKCMINIIYHFISVSVHRYRQPCWPLGWDGSLRHGWGEPMQIRARVLARPRYNTTGQPVTGWWQAWKLIKQSKNFRRNQTSETVVQFRKTWKGFRHRSPISRKFCERSWGEFSELQWNSLRPKQRRKLPCRTSWDETRCCRNMWN